MELLFIILIISIFCNGLYLISHDGMVLDGFRLWLAQAVSDRWYSFIYKPFIGCIICMSSIWGTIVYWSFKLFSITPENLIMWPIACVCASYVNYLLYNIIHKLEE